MTGERGADIVTLFRIDLFSEKFNTFGDIEKCLRELAGDLHAGKHEIRNDNGEIVGEYGVVRLLR